MSPGKTTLLPGRQAIKARDGFDGKVVLYARTRNGACPVRKFLESLDRPRQARLEKVIKDFADDGDDRQGRRVKALGEGLSEFRDPGSANRILFGYEAGRIILLAWGTGRKRPGGKGALPRREIERALEVLRDFKEIWDGGV